MGDKNYVLLSVPQCLSSAICIEAFPAHISKTSAFVIFQVKIWSSSICKYPCRYWRLVHISSPFDGHCYHLHTRSKGRLKRKRVKQERYCRKKILGPPKTCSDTERFLANKDIRQQLQLLGGTAPALKLQLIGRPHLCLCLLFKAVKRIITYLQTRQLRDFAFWLLLLLINLVSKNLFSWSIKNKIDDRVLMWNQLSSQLFTSPWVKRRRPLNSFLAKESFSSRLKLSMLGWGIRARVT